MLAAGFKAPFKRRNLNYVVIVVVVTAVAVVVAVLMQRSKSFYSSAKSIKYCVHKQQQQKTLLVVNINILYLTYPCLRCDPGGVIVFLFTRLPGDSYRTRFGSLL